MFNILAFALLNVALNATVNADAKPAGPLEVLQFIDMPPAPKASKETFHTKDGDVVQFIDFGFNPVRIDDDEEYIDQDGPEDGQVFADEDGDVLQFVGAHGSHEDVIYINDDGAVEVEEFADAGMARDPASEAPRVLPSRSPLNNENSTQENFTRDFTRDFSPEINSTLANNSTEENFTRDFTRPPKNSTEGNFTRYFSPEINSTLANNSTERSFTDSYLGGNNSTALPDGEDNGGLLDGILDFFEGLFRF